MKTAEAHNAPLTGAHSFNPNIMRGPHLRAQSAPARKPMPSDEEMRLRIDDLATTANGGRITGQSIDNIVAYIKELLEAQK